MFRPPSMPRQLALSDVRKAGFIADHVKATMDKQQQQRQQQQQQQQQGKEQPSDSKMTIRVDVRGGQVTQESTSIPQAADLRPDPDPFDVLKPIPITTPTANNDIGVALGLNTNDFTFGNSGGGGLGAGAAANNNYSFLDSPFTFEQLGDFGGGLNAGHGVYEEEYGDPESFGFLDKSNNHSLERLREIDDLKDFKLQLDSRYKQKSEGEGEDGGKDEEERESSGKKVKRAVKVAKKEQQSDRKEGKVEDEKKDDADADVDGEQRGNAKEGGGGKAENEQTAEDDDAEVAELYEDDFVDEGEELYADDFVDDDGDDSDAAAADAEATAGLDKAQEAAAAQKNEQVNVNVNPNEKEKLGANAELSGEGKEEEEEGGHAELGDNDGYAGVGVGEGEADHDHEHDYPSDLSLLSNDIDKYPSIDGIDDETEASAQYLPGLDQVNTVALGVISGGEQAAEPSIPTSFVIGGDPVNERKPLPSGDFLSEIAQLKAAATELNVAYEKHEKRK